MQIYKRIKKMVEFTLREKQIVHAMNIMNNPALSDIDFELKTQALQSVLLICGYEWNENEMIDLMQAIGQESNYANQSSMRALHKHKDIFKRLTKLPT